MKDETLRLALEAFKTCIIDADGWSGPNYSFDEVKVGKAITTIKQALAQPEPEPVAWVIQSNLISASFERDRGGRGDLHTWSETPTAYHSVPLYASPPKREWQGLTQEDIFGIADKCGLASVDWTDVMHAVEAKLKEKNHGQD